MAETPAPPTRPRTVAACLLLVVLALATGCVQSPDSTPAPAAEETATDESTASPTGSDALESRLVDLASADDPAAFAADNGIDYDDGSVSVVVALREGATLPDGYDAETRLATDGRVQASVPVAELGALAAHGNVTYVRTTREPNA